MRRLVMTLLAAAAIVTSGAVPGRAAAVGYVLRGRIEADTGKLEDAVADFSLAIKIDPAVGDYYTLRSRALKQLHRDDLAKADLDQAIALAPK